MKKRDLLLAPAAITLLISFLFFCQYLAEMIRHALSQVYLSILGWSFVYVGWAALAAGCTTLWAKLYEKEHGK